MTSIHHIGKEGFEKEKIIVCNFLVFLWLKSKI